MVTTQVCTCEVGKWLVLLFGVGVSVYLPRVEDKSSNMRMLRVVHLAGDLEKNSMSILEPTPLMPDGTVREDGNPTYPK